MLALLFATGREAAPLLDRMADGRTDNLQVGDRIELGDVIVAVIGTGKIKATYVTGRLLEDYRIDAVISAGEAVSLSADLETGDILGAVHVLEGDRVELQDPSYPRMPLEMPFESVTEGALVSQDYTADESEESYWERIADARDSVGYAVAFVAGKKGVPCYVVRGIAEPDSAEKKAEGATNACEVVADLLDRELDAARPEDQSDS